MLRIHVKPFGMNPRSILQRLLQSAIAPLLVLLAANVEPAAAQALSRADQASLAAGEVVIKVEADQQPSVARIDAAIDIPAAPARVWAAMLDCARAPKFIDGLVSCLVLERDPTGSRDVREHVVSWGALWPKIRSVFRSDYDVNRSISFQRVAGDIDVLEGTWTLEALSPGGATRVRYIARVGKETMIPGALIRAAIESDVPKTLRSLRKEVLRVAG
jgi:ribosome-associated toxin RatA of RatAB toxin-antitoxin module